MVETDSAEEQHNDKEVFLAAYTDRLSGRPGDSIRVCVSCGPPPTSSLSAASPEAPPRRPVWARLVRSICADPNPQGPGIWEESASSWFAPRKFLARHQSIPGGSYAVTQDPIQLFSDDVRDDATIGIDLWLYWTSRRTVKKSKLQCIWSWGGDGDDNNNSLGLYLNANGNLILSGNGGGTTATVTTRSFQLPTRKWYHCSVVLERSQEQGTIQIWNSTGKLVCHVSESVEGILMMTASATTRRHFGLATGGTFNGRLESPRIRDAKNGKTIVAWDTFQNMSGWTIPGTTSEEMIGRSVTSLCLHHHPTRGVKGHLWDGTEFCWKHRPNHYGAIHFHDDDCYDFQWESDLVWTIPEGTPSGIYILHLTAADDDGKEHIESLPIMVCPPRDQNSTSKAQRLCVLVSTFTYVMYGNHARSDFDRDAWFHRVQDWKAYPHNPVLHANYGLSTYNFHSDGSGIHFASHRRPLFTLRPAYLSLAHTTCSGLRHFPADSHLIAFLHHYGMEYDVITDHELHQEGVACIRGYSTLLTGSHPEYHSLETLNALQSFRDNEGGNLVYLGGNGFYWRIAVTTLPETTTGEDEEKSNYYPSLLEIRRAEDGVRTWAAEPGEYHHVLDPTASYGGLWRRNNRPPQQLVGVGFCAQGSFVGMPYQRKCYDPKMDWVFEGIPSCQWERLGDFGFSGGGAAGFELDRVDRQLDGDSHDIVILAQAFDPQKQFMFVPEEVLTTYSNLSGLTEDEARRSDMIYFQTEDSGAQVFSVGSITFCGSLPWNGFENPIATLLCNVIRRFLASSKLPKKHESS